MTTDVPRETEPEPETVLESEPKSESPPIENHMDFCTNGPEDGELCDCENYDDDPEIQWCFCSTGAVNIGFQRLEGCALIVSTGDWWVGDTAVVDGCPRRKKCHHIKQGEGGDAGTYRSDSVGEISFYPDPLCEMSCPDD